MIEKKKARKKAVVKKLPQKENPNFLQKADLLLNTINKSYYEAIAAELKWNKRTFYRRVRNGRINAQETIAVMQAFEKVMGETLDEMRNHPNDMGIIYKINARL